MFPTTRYRWGNWNWTRPALELRTELMLGTDPRVKDTDGDGLTDGEEVAGWTLATGAAGPAAPPRVRSDPRQADSDSDGLSDRDEKDRQTDPLRRNIKVPSVVKMKREDAIKRLEEAKLTYTVTTREEEKEPAGLVLEQSPRGGDLVEEDAETTLVVSVQSAQVAAPSVVGMSEDDAIRRLKEAGLGYHSVTRPDWDNKAGSVLEQSHVPGTKLERNSQIELWVAIEPPDLWVEFKHSGAYVAKFYLSWEDDRGPQHWESGKKSAGYSEKIWFKRKNTRQIHIKAQAMTGLVWQPWGDIWDLKFAEPPNATFIAKGTTLHRSYEKK